MDQRLKNKLNKRKEEGTMRSLSLFQDHADFISNDYLGLAKLNFGTEMKDGGSGGSRLLSGNSLEAEHCEQFIAKHFAVEASLVFNSGYTANLSLFGSVPQRGDTILYDQHIHASVRDGIRLSFAASQSFAHNDVEDLELKLTRASGRAYVAVESLYSMGGDFSPLGKILSVCNRYNAFLIVDEAHSVGVFGHEGRGVVDLMQNKEEIFARLMTFGKAFGAHGSALLCSSDLKNYLINFARPFIYTTAMPPSAYLRMEKSLEYSGLNQARTSLMEKIQFFVTQMGDDERLISEPNSPIQMLKIGDVNTVKRMELKLQEKKLAVKAIYPPTVKVGEEGLRLCFHSFNTKNEIDVLISCLRVI